MTKKCIKCGYEKELNEYHKLSQNKDKHSNKCKVCTNEYSRKWQLDNKERWNKYKREQWKNNAQFRAAHHGRTCISHIIRDINARYKFLVDCGAGSREAFMAHLISTIPDGYTIDDYGTQRFHNKLCVDHIVPCSSFDLTNREEYKTCFNYKNLRLITKEDNAIKSSSI